MSALCRPAFIIRFLCVCVCVCDSSDECGRSEQLNPSSHPDANTAQGKVCGFVNTFLCVCVCGSKIQNSFLCVVVKNAPKSVFVCLYVFMCVCECVYVRSEERRVGRECRSRW